MLFYKVLLPDQFVSHLNLHKRKSSASCSAAEPDEEEQQRDRPKRKRAMQAEEGDAAGADDIRASGEMCTLLYQSRTLFGSQTAFCMAMHAQHLLKAMSVSHPVA